MLLTEIGDEASVRRINMNPLKQKFTRNLHSLVHLITGYGFKIRIVGGAVRDVLLGRPARDIDMITDAVPDAVMYILSKHKIPYRTKGIKHGTVKVRFSDDEEYEITSLGYEVDDECCPQSVVIHSGQSWKGDAERRDFTVDTLSVDLDGLMYDYMDGVKDLRHQFVRFIGDPKERIQKDPVLILRFFRLLSLFRDPKFDKGVLPLIQKKMKLVKRVKPERIERELENIKGGPSGEKVRRLMKNLGFDEVMADAKKKVDETRLIKPHNSIPKRHQIRRPVAEARSFSRTLMNLLREEETLPPAPQPFNPNPALLTTPPPGWAPPQPTEQPSSESVVKPDAYPYTHEEKTTWKGGPALRYFEGPYFSTNKPEETLVIGVGQHNQGLWQIWNSADGIAAIGHGQEKLNAALAQHYHKYISGGEPAPTINAQVGEPQSALAPPQPEPTPEPAPVEPQIEPSAEPATPAEPRNMNPNVIDVGGDEWNRQLAVRLEQEYINAVPAIEEIVQQATGLSLPTPSPEDSDDEDPEYSGYSEWDDLSGHLQEETETNWKDYHHSSYYDSEVENWQDQDGSTEALDQVVDDYDNGAVTDWLTDAVDDYLYEREEAGLPPPPYTIEQLIDAIEISNDDGEPLVAFKDDELQHPSTFTQYEMLPGFGDRNWAAELSKEMRLGLEQVVQKAFQKAISEKDVDPPDYLEDSVQEFLHDSWNQLDDHDKFQWAVNHIHGVEEQEEVSRPEERVHGLPHRFDPLNETSGHDYKKTQALARYISETRASALLIERGLWTNERVGPWDEVHSHDKDLWQGWKDSSTSDQGLAIQVAAADELGGRLRMPPNRRQEAIDIANRRYRTIGGLEGVKAIIRAKWETTQWLLEKAGVDVLNLYRSVGIENVTDERMEEYPSEYGEYTRLPDVVLHRNGAASTTTDASVANNWGGTHRRVVLRIQAPRTAALSVPCYGINVHSEHEVVLAGTAWSAWDAWFGTAPSLKRIPLQQRPDIHLHDDAELDTLVDESVMKEGKFMGLNIDLFAMELASKLPNWLNWRSRNSHRIKANREKHRKSWLARRASAQDKPLAKPNIREF